MAEYTYRISISMYGSLHPEIRNHSYFSVQSFHSSSRWLWVPGGCQMAPSVNVSIGNVSMEANTNEHRGLPGAILSHTHRSCWAEAQGHLKLSWSNLCVGCCRRRILPVVTLCSTWTPEHNLCCYWTWIHRLPQWPGCFSTRNDACHKFFSLKIFPEALIGCDLCAVQHIQSIKTSVLFSCEACRRKRSSKHGLVLQSRPYILA